MFTIPNLITAVNLLAGCLSCVLVLQENWTGVIILMVIAQTADFLDGYVARLMGQTSKIGVQLDSLADVVSFGLVPGLVIYQLLTNYEISELPYLGFVLPVAAAFRLARFNVETNEKPENFQGLPVPAMAIAIAGLLPLGEPWPDVLDWKVYWEPFVILTLFLSGWMISRFPVIKFAPTGTWIRSYFPLALLMLICLTGAGFGYLWCLSLMIITYIAYSYFALSKKN